MSITRRQREVLDWIEQFIAEKRYSPSYAEVAAGVGLASSSTAHRHIRNLAERGFLTIDYNRSRSIDIVRR
jgi:repressor LexA